MDEVSRTDDVVVVRSEERLQASTRSMAVGRAVLRRRIVTEERTVTVLVRHEEAVLEVVPFDEPVPADDGRGAAHRALPAFVLHEEEVVVTTRVVPVERVRLEVRAEREDRVVTADVRRERITLEDTAATGSANADE